MSEGEKPGLYVHVPFCRTKCPYCDFYSVTTLTCIDAWLEAVGKEVLRYEGKFGRFDTIYLGGGTPSILDNRQMTTLMNCLRRVLDFSLDAEITIEANPDDIDDEKLELFLDLGFNRVSLGVQSLDENVLRFLKRRHDRLQTIRAVELIRRSSFKNLSVDLIYGVQGQGVDGWRETLERVLEFGPEHLSCYQMTVEDRTPFGRMMAEGKIRPLDEKHEEELFLQTSKALVDQGYIHYEISNFARDEHHISRHNSKYWRHAPYLGLGPAAHSFCGKSRWWNVRSVEDYCRTLERGKAPVGGQEILSSEQLKLEALYLGLRTRDGVDLRLISEESAAEAVLSRLVNSGIVRVRGDRLLPTRKGFLVADSLPVLFSS